MHLRRILRSPRVQDSGQVRAVTDSCSIIKYHRPGGEVETLGIANPPCAGSIPAQASKMRSILGCTAAQVVRRNDSNRCHFYATSEYIQFHSLRSSAIMPVRRGGGMVDTRHLRRRGRKIMWVRVPPSAHSRGLFCRVSHSTLSKSLALRVTDPPVAQLVEQRPLKPTVPGSIPGGRTSVQYRHGDVVKWYTRLP